MLKFLFRENPNNKLLPVGFVMTAFTKADYIVYRFVTQAIVVEMVYMEVFRFAAYGTLVGKCSSEPVSFLNP